MSLFFLIGMPGVGKTYWGRTWARAYGYDFADLDKQAESQTGVSIPDIFRSMGEEGFRVLEASVLLSTIAAARGRNMVIATGGGTPVHNDNMNTMLRSGFVVYLSAGVDTLLKNIGKSPELRPLLLQTVPKTATLEALLEQRKPFYERAHMTVSVEQARTDTFAQIIDACTSRQS